MTPIVCQYENRILFRGTTYDFKTLLAKVAEGFDSETAIFQTQEHAEKVFEDLLANSAYSSDVLDSAHWYSRKIGE